MADVAWIMLKVWPWNDEWLGLDDELLEAFRSLGLADGHPFRLVGAMNGEAEVDDGLQGVRIEGEMRGGSYQIREESNLLEALHERGIAYFLKGDAKYEWDGDETWWHPGMAEPVQATANESGVVLTAVDFQEMKKVGSLLLERAPQPFDPRLLVARIEAFFAASPFEWLPPDGYAPSLKLEPVEES